ncbi:MULTISPECIES: TetR/AcrR family transcriptional regulator [Nocardia]|uniref:TetR family transcriptional regulator n=1 Tax=Nocardia sputorum TaxID=2984338 RepID=A0ABN6U3G1_9NOCA|nr:TetR/AcrR family transcriptional regulator [Nocardia sputorum]BDT90910.1 TetR family transcriptional regulator [Nocardia sputorum]BDT99540.1 TetR family transcriptional regulator [Nocardia sputorum]
MTADRPSAADGIRPSDVGATNAAPRRSRKAAAQQRGRTPRLSYEAWVDGALTLLAREGVSAIRIPRLCQELGVTKGSFYWHFDDIEQLMAAMADRWTARQSEIIRALGAIASVPVEQRIADMAANLIDQGTWATEATVREWARSDEKVAETVRALDRQIFETVRKAMLELGFTPDGARLRAGAMVYLGIGFIHGRDSLPAPTAEDARAILELLTIPAPKRTRS